MLAPVRYGRGRSDRNERRGQLNVSRDAVHGDVYGCAGAHNLELGRPLTHGKPSECQQQGDGDRTAHDQATDGPSGTCGFPECARHGRLAGDVVLPEFGSRLHHLGIHMRPGVISGVTRR